MDKFELQKLRDLPIEAVAERLGIEIVRHKALCPFHDDHHASLSFSVRRNTFRCFACGAHGGPIDLAMKLLPHGGGGEGASFREACQWLGAPLSSPQGGKPKNIQSSFPLGEDGRGLFDASRYARFFERPWLSPEACKFLFDERRIDPRVVRWCRLTSWRDRQGIDWLQIPYYDREGKLIGIQNRNLSFKILQTRVLLGDAHRSEQARAQDSSAKDLKPETCDLKPAAPRFRFPQVSECSIYNLPVLNLLKPGEPLYITEGCSDCWAMLSSGHKAIAIPSATLLKPKDVEVLETLNLELGTPFHMYPDRDLPGERLFLQLKKVLPNLEHHQLPPGCKDYADYYVKIHDSGFKFQDNG